MNCTICGTKLPEGAAFCLQCGTAIPRPPRSIQGPAIVVDQQVKAVEGQILGLSVSAGALQGNLNAQVNQGIDEVKGGGTAIGAVIGTEGSVHVGGRQSYGDVVQGDKVEGDKIAVDSVSGEAIGIGRYAQVTSDRGFSRCDLAVLLEPILQAARSGPPEKRDRAVQDAEKLQAEIAKGKQADDETMAGLIESLTGLIPGTVSAVTIAFRSPLLDGIVGPVTGYVLKRLTLQM